MTAGAGERGAASGPSRRAGAAVVAVVLLVVGATLASCANEDDAGTDRSRRALLDGAPAAAEPPSGDSVSTAASGDGPIAVATPVAQFGALLTSFTSTPDGHDLLVGDRTGVVHRLVRGRVGQLTVPELQSDPILDVSADVSLLGESGFFDMKLVDDGRYLVVCYEAVEGALKVVRYPYRQDRPVNPATAEVVVSLPFPYSWHHGGSLAVDRDGGLFVGVGDMEFRNFDPPGPQDTTRILGAIFKIPAAVLAAPTIDWTVALTDVVARGFRNPWRMSVDHSTGTLWLGDVGQAETEEFDVMTESQRSAGITNFGWPYYEGTRANQNGPAGDYTAPFLERHHSDGFCGAVGGFVYRGAALPALVGRYVFGDLCSVEVSSVAATPDAPGDPVEVAQLPGPIVSFGQGPGGELYLLGSTGTLYRLDPADWSVAAADQSPRSTLAPTTTAARSATPCERQGGIVDATFPMQSMNNLGPADLQATIEQMDRDLAALVPTLPPDVVDDGRIVQRAMLALTEQLARSGWSLAAPEMRSLREDIATGQGPFAGFPDAMARAVDRECG